MQELTERPEDLIRSASLLVLLFGDEACTPCHALRNRLDAWANRHPEAEARYIPIREHPETCAQMGIFSAPTVLITMDGQVMAPGKRGFFPGPDAGNGRTGTRNPGRLTLQMTGGV